MPPEKPSEYGLPDLMSTVVLGLSVSSFRSTTIDPYSSGSFLLEEEAAQEGMNLIRDIRRLGKPKHLTANPSIR